MGTETNDSSNGRAGMFSESPNGGESDPLPADQPEKLNELGYTNTSSPSPTLPDELEREGSERSNKEDMKPPRCLRRFSFPYWFVASLYEFGVYINKLFQDSYAVHNYHETGDYAYMVISIGALVSPAILYVIYLLGSRFAKLASPKCGDWFTCMINGLLLIPWQIKGRAEVLQFTSQRICAGREPTSEEGEAVKTLNRQASVLEFFEQFYAGFLQLALQLYILGLTLISADNREPSISQIVGSCLAIISTVRAVRRKDDGILTGCLSYLGWLAFYASRVMAFSLAACIIHGWIALICAIHVIGMSAWITAIAWKSYQMPSDDSDTPEPLAFRRKTSIAFLVTAMFGLPSLVYWPIMFQLKERKRLLIFILVCACENVASFLLWFFSRGKENITFSTVEIVCSSILFGGFALGVFFIYLYSCCKPKYTDAVVMHDMKVENANSYGIFYAFFDATFKLPKTDGIHLHLKRIRNV